MPPALRLALAALLLALPLGSAAAQGGGPPRPQAAAPAPAPVRWKDMPAAVAIVAECHDAVGARGTPPQALAGAVKVCVKDRTRPVRRACAKAARGQGFVKRTPDYKDFVKGCIADELAAAFGPPRPGAAVQAPTQAPGAASLSDDDGEDMFFDED